MERVPSWMGLKIYSTCPFKCLCFPIYTKCSFLEGKDLTILDAVSFIIAIPTTVIWKTIKGTAPPLVNRGDFAKHLDGVNPLKEGQEWEGQRTYPSWSTPGWACQYRSCRDSIWPDLEWSSRFLDCLQFYLWLYFLPLLGNETPAGLHLPGHRLVFLCPRQGDKYCNLDYHHSEQTSGSAAQQDLASRFFTNCCPPSKL